MLTDALKTVPSLTARHWARSESKYARAMALLPDALEDPARLVDYARTLNEAIADQPRNPEPYFALGMLHIWLQNHSQARICLLKVLSLAPHDQDARILLETLENELESSGLEADLELEDIEAALHALMRELSAMRLEPTANGQVLLEQHGHYAKAMAHYRRLNARIQTLSTEVESVRLGLLLKPLEQGLARLRQILSYSEGLCGIVTFSQRLQRHVASHLRSGRRDQAAEALLEDTMDACDALADALDSLESQGIEILEAATSYRRLLVLVEQWQDQLDASEVN